MARISSCHTCQSTKKAFCKHVIGNKLESNFFFLNCWLYYIEGGGFKTFLKVV